MGFRLPFSLRRLLKIKVQLGAPAGRAGPQESRQSNDLAPQQTSCTGQREQHRNRTGDLRGNPEPHVDCAGLASPSNCQSARDDSLPLTAEIRRVVFLDPIRSGVRTPSSTSLGQQPLTLVRLHANAQDKHANL